MTNIIFVLTGWLSELSKRFLRFLSLLFPCEVALLKSIHVLLLIQSLFFLLFSFDHCLLFCNELPEHKTLRIFNRNFVYLSFFFFFKFINCLPGN